MLRNKLILSTAMIFLVLIISFVLAEHTITTTDATVAYSLNESVPFIYNITVNNSDIAVGANITQVNITIPSSFNFTFDTNNTVAADFANTSTVLSWSNYSDYLVNSSEIVNFSFNATADIPGAYNITIATVNASGIFETNISITINDSEIPGVVINYPTNNSLSLSSVEFNVTISENVGISQCWYTIEAGATNFTMGNKSATVYNYTNTSIADGSYNLTAWCNDTAGNINYTEEISFFIDDTFTNMTVINPAVNNTNSSDNLLDVNFTFLEINSDSCWYSNDTYDANTTLASCGNITDVTWEAGPHNVTIWANDSSNNENHTTISFTVDTVVPNVTINYPTNNSLSLSSVEFNVTIAENIGIYRCWYSIEAGASNVTMGNKSATVYNQTNISIADGSYNLTAWCNDTAGNINYTEELSFFIDDTFTNMTVITPTANNTNSSNNLSDVNFTFLEINSDSCWYSNDTYDANTTLASCGNITAVTWDEGGHNVTIWANDSSNNENHTSISFTVDVTRPVPTASITGLTSGEATLSVSINELTFCNYSGGGLGAGEIGTGISLSQGLGGLSSSITYTALVTCNDSANNENTTSVAFTTPSTTSAGGSSSASTDSWTKTIAVNDNNFKIGYTAKLSAKHRVKVNVGSAAHHVGVSKLTSTTATISVTSSTQTATLSVGETKKFDVTGNGYYDISVNLKSISNNQAEVTVKSISEKMPVTAAEPEDEEVVAEESTGETPREEPRAELTEAQAGLTWLWVLIIVVVVLIVAGIIIKKKGRSGKKKK